MEHGPDPLSDTMPEGTGRLSGIRERQPVSKIRAQARAAVIAGGLRSEG